jgi:hypothetical protein
MEGGAVLPNDRDYIARKERYDELRQEAERDRLIEIAQAHQASQRKLGRKIVVWIANQLIEWGSKLQRQSGLDENKGERLQQFKELVKNTD